MKKTDRRLSLRKETIAQLSTQEVALAAGGIRPSDQCTQRCSKVQGGCASAGPTLCA